MAAVGQLTTKDVLFPLKDSFDSKVDIDSLIEVLDQNQLLKKKEKKLLQRVDETAKKSIVFGKLYSADQSLSVDRLLKLFTDTENEKNMHFSKALQSIVSSIQKSATIELATLPPFKYTCPLDDHPSAIFSSAGGVLYSPVYGVTVYIPAGAILEEKQVKVSFWLVTEEAEIREFLSSPLLEGTVVCSGVFEFEAKFVDAPDGVKFDEFQSDVWIELPHCLSFRGGSLNDYSRAFVVSDSKGKVGVETQALFSEGYPYVNLPVRHFSKFSVADSPKKRFVPALHVRKALPKLNVSRSLEKYPANDSTTEQVKKAAQTAAASPSADEKRRLYFEMKKTSSEASAEEEKRQALIRQDASANLSDQDVMEVDPPAPAGTASSTSLQQEDPSAPALSLVACVCQPADRHKQDRWTADIVFAPLLPKALKDLAKYQKQMKREIHTVAFHLDVRLQLIQLLSEPSTQEWLVELSTTKISLQHFTTVAPLLIEDLKSSEITLLPRAVAMVQKQGTSFPLHHRITVEGSWPKAHCYISCEGETRSVKGAGLKPKTADAETVSSDPPAQVAPEDLHSPTPTTVQWERDRYILALISIMVPEDQLVTLGEGLGLPPLIIDQVRPGYTAGSVPNVGERAYEMFKRARQSEQPVTFGKILVILSEIDRSNHMVSILRSYIQSRLVAQPFGTASTGTPAETESTDGPSALFITWLCDCHPTLIPRASSAAMERAILPKKRQLKLFLDLSKRMVRVWRMVGRFLGLPDWEIDVVDINSSRSHDDVCESCYQMLLRWAKHSQRPEGITYGRLMSALKLTSLGVGAASDATYYLYRFTPELANARSIPDHA